MAMYKSRLLRAQERKQLRATDVIRLAAGAALLTGVLAVLVFVAPRLKPAQIELSPEQIAENARQATLKAALAHREGTILFVDPEMCYEHSFDNWTGAIAYKEQIDCDARLAKLRKSETERSAERVRSVVEGFRR
ncbi:hypothetical protein [Pseudolabrys sp. FHR47]|uniref:hypothetical protein n=1 Tax=Pseudolabrys sp. FHR47 TaxID=2562284 RepID=UPI0010BF1C77|nr:hypothetical protein [Pseudolabrys sp. FHR47]